MSRKKKVPKHLCLSVQVLFPRTTVVFVTANSCLGTSFSESCENIRDKFKDFHVSPILVFTLYFYISIYTNTTLKLSRNDNIFENIL